MLLIDSSLRCILLVLSLVPLMDAINTKDRWHEPRASRLVAVKGKSPWTEVLRLLAEERTRSRKTHSRRSGERATQEQQPTQSRRPRSAIVASRTGDAEESFGKQPLSF